MEFELGQKIRKVRELKGFSQEYMADRLGISQKVYSNIENDKRKMDKETIQNISEVFEIHPNDLLSFDEKTLFTNCHHSGVFNFSTIHNTLSERESKLFEDRIAQLEEENAFLKKEIEFLHSIIKQPKK